MEWYILKSVAILASLLLFYKLLLEKENMHTFKRFYLLTAVVAAVGIPLITITTYVEPAQGNFEPISFAYSEEVSVAKNRSFTDYLPFILWAIYALGVIFFSFKFIKNLRELLLKIKTNPKIKTGNFTRILLREKVDPHTFFSYIFLNRKKYEQQQIPKEVIIHEEAHAEQKHSLDVLFVELLQIVFWMNPLIILLKDAMKLNHEFLADRAVIKKGIQTAGYQNTLLSFSSGHLHSDLVNPINYSSIKKRFTVMKTHTSRQAIWVRGFLILPLILVLVYGFSTRKVLERENVNLQNFTNQELNQFSEANGNITSVQISEVISIEIFKDGNLLINNKATDLTKLSSEIKKITSKQLNRFNKKIEKAYIEIDPETPMGIITDVKETILKSGISEVYLASGGEDTSKGWGKNIYKRIADQEKATPEMIAEYNRLAQHYNSMAKEATFIKMEDSKRMQYIYNLMTPEQKKKAENYPVASPPPPPADSYVAEYNELARHFNSISKNTDISENKKFKRMLDIYNVMSAEQKAKAEKFPSHLIPSPPPPPAPNMNDVPAPPPPPTLRRDGLKVPPAPPTTVQGNIQAPPPPPPSPKESVLNWIEEGAEFFYNGKKTTGQYILEIVEKNDGKNLDVHVQENASGKTVRISDKESPNQKSPASSRDGLKTPPASPAPAKVNRPAQPSPYNLSTTSRQTTEKLSLLITPKVVVVNGKETNVRGVANLVDKATSDWTMADFNLHGLEIKVAEDVSKDLINRLNVELQKTKLVKSLNSGSAYIPYPNESSTPPPAPSIEEYLTEDSMIYLGGKIISAETALNLLKTKRDNLKVSIHQNGEENTVITMVQTR